MKMLTEYNFRCFIREIVDMQNALSAGISNIQKNG